MDNTFDRPRFRGDLVAQSIEDEGIRYVDVSDPNSGATFRFYDVEYSIACAMDGERDLQGLAEWTRTELGIETDADELQNVVATLADLGYLEQEGLAEGSSTAAEAQAEEPVTPRPEDLGDGHEVEEPTLAFDRPRGAAPATEPEAPEIEVSETDVTAVRAAPETLPPGADAGIGDSLEDDGEPTASLPIPQPTDTAVTAKAEAARIEAARMEAAGGEPRPKATAAPSFDDEPTQLPKPMVEPDEDFVPVDLGEHIKLDKDEVKEAVRASQAMAVPELPKDLESEAAALGLSAPAAKSAVEGEESGPSLAELAKASSPPVQAEEAKPAKPAAAAAALAPTVPVPVVPPPARPVLPTKAPAAAAAPARSRATVVVLLVLLLVAIAAVAVYYKKILNGGESSSSEAPPPGRAQPEQPAPAPAPAPAPVLPVATLVEAASPPVEVKATAAGIVAWLILDGDKVAAGDPVVKYQNYKKFEIELKAAEDRHRYYVGKLAGAQEAGNEADIALFQRKVEEKQGLIDEAQAQLAAVVVSAPAAGVVKVRVAAGARVAQGDTVATVSPEGAAVVTGTFQVADSSGYREGAPCVVAAKDAPDKALACVVDAAEDRSVTVRLVPGGAARAGDEVVLLPPK